MSNIRVAAPRRRLVAAAAGVAALAAHGPVAAQSWPSRPLKLILPFPPGGPTDILARLIAGKLGERLGQQVVVEVKAGAGGIIGTEAVARAEPDGYTLLIGTIGTHGINSAIYRRLPYDPIADFAPIALVANVTNLLVVHPSVPAKTLAELLALARAKPGELTFASAGVGSSQHLSAELLKSMAKVDLLHVPYKGGAQAAADAIGGQVNLVFAQVPALLAHLQSGRLRPLAVTSAKRFPGLPELPSFTELGVEYDVNPWFGLLAPAGTPKPVVERTTQAMRKVLNGEELSRRIRGAGAEPGYGTPEECGAVLRRDIAFWQQVRRTYPQLAAPK